MEKKLPAFILLAIIITVISCEKKDIATNAKISYDAALNSKSIAAATLTGRPSFPLDWENITYMPSPSGITPIPVPWQSGLGGTKIDQDMLYDYAKSDGWELVYNTFNDSIVYNPSYFMLYNKYRGVLRTYFYFSPGQNYPSNNIVSEILLNGSSASTSPALNFSGNDIVDFTTNHTAVTQLQPYQVSSTGSWYASEFELAYDKNMAAISYPNTTLEWQINPNSIAQISLNGNETGSIDGTIAVPSSKTNFFGTLVNTLVNTAVTATGGVLSEGASALGFLIKKESGKPDDHSVQKSAITAIGNGLSGTISGFLNGILGFTKKSTTNEKVSLTLNSNITVNGTSTVSSQLFDNNFAIPGTANNTQAIPFYPAYNLPMGVFYISNIPNVKITNTSYNIDHPADPDGARVDVSIKTDLSSFALDFNPNVLAIADIANIRYNLLLKMPETMYGGQLIPLFPEENIMGDSYFATGATTGFTLVGPTKFIIGNDFLFLRVAFDVVPKDGSPKQTIVKTFKVNRS